jgi:hypothetical protein
MRDDVKLLLLCGEAINEPRCRARAVRDEYPKGNSPGRARLPERTNGAVFVMPLPRDAHLRGRLTAEHSGGRAAVPTRVLP